MPSTMPIRMIVVSFDRIVALPLAHPASQLNRNRAAATRSIGTALPKRCASSHRERSQPRKIAKTVTNPIDHDACGVITLEVVLHQKPHVAAFRQGCDPQTPVGEKIFA